MKNFFTAAIMVLLGLFSVLLVGCSTSPPKAPEGMQRFEGFEKAVRMKEWKAKAVPVASPLIPIDSTVNQTTSKTKKASRSRHATLKKTEKDKLIIISNDTPPQSRRPNLDPFRPGEATVLNVRFKGLGAGNLTLGVGNFVEVNDRKAYDLNLHLRSNKVFSLLHYINDRAQIFFDYENLLPLASSYHGEQKKRLTEVRTIFNWSTLKVDEWVKRVIEGEGLSQDERHWDIKPLSQNLLSGIFFLRTMALTPGQKIHFPATQKGENFTFEAEVLRKETLDTNAGKFDTVVVKIVTRLEELLKTTGDTLLWLTDDDRKFPVRLETQIKEGNLKAEAQSINRGA